MIAFPQQQLLESFSLLRLKVHCFLTFFSNKSMEEALNCKKETVLWPLNFWTGTDAWQ